MTMIRALAGAAIAAATAMLLGGAAHAQSAGTGVKPADSQRRSAAADVASVGATRVRAGKADYDRARWDPIHFKPAIDSAKNDACLVCHSEIMNGRPREQSPAGVKATEVEAWYQTLETYGGKQESFHWRHLQSPFSRQVMSLQCNFCHQGSDPREKSPHVTAGSSNGARASSWPGNAPAFTLRKTVNPTETCLRCHGAFPADNMGLSGSWHENREGLETAEAPNGCLSCHAEQFRTVRHKVSYLKPEAIEKLAQKNSDVCFGCHGGRQWYRISYPYPRHPWPNMPDAPDWAKDRPTQSDARFQLPQKK